MRESASPDFCTTVGFAPVHCTAKFSFSVDARSLLFSKQQTTCSQTTLSAFFVDSPATSAKASSWSPHYWTVLTKCPLLKSTPAEMFLCICQPVPLRMVGIASVVRHSLTRSASYHPPSNSALCRPRKRHMTHTLCVSFIVHCRFQRSR